MTREERIEALTILNEQARYYGDNTFVWSINIDSFKFVIESTIKALEQETVSKESYDHEYFLRKEFEIKIDKLEHDKNNVLDKIRAEIEHMLPCSKEALSMKLGVLEIIDKYKAESENKE